METFFASPERKTKSDLQIDIDLVTENPVINGLLNTVNGFFAVLNENRQILSVNKTLLKSLQIEDITEILGLRPGEALDCIHSHEMPGGCGTSEYCITCGAAIAIVVSLKRSTPEEKECSMEINKEGKKEDLYLRIRSHPIEINNQKLILLFLQDISYQQKLIALERIFFHDISNLVSVLINTSNTLSNSKTDKKERAIERVSTITSRLAQEINVQRRLMNSDLKSGKSSQTLIPVSLIFKTIKSMIPDHPFAQDKRLVFVPLEKDIFVHTDLSLLTRIICNMAINALEASGVGDEVTIRASKEHNFVIFGVQNKQVIPPDIQKRIFQRNFSTKKGLGRGLGTYSMKLLGEEFLGGKVAFSSTEEKGTEFTITLASSNS
ncbi:MAG: HAMP domain-containing histidine kinase [Proteobacteria bacterium]|nr:HAMP domain-containing histidine kinase [Pseudomonadota bacterium]